MLGTHPFVRFLNQNRRQIRITIIVIIVFLLILRILNSLAEKQLEKQALKDNIQNVEIENSNEHKQAIKNFLEFCIKKDESSAYALLSSESKEKLYKTKNEFNKNYILKYFSTNKKYTITYIKEINGKYYYSVKILEDVLSTGKVDIATITQNYEVTKENGEYKIIINMN